MQVLQNTQLSFSLKLMGKVKSVTDFMPQGRFTQCRNLFLNNWIPHVTLELYKFFKIYTYILQSIFTFIQSTYRVSKIKLFEFKLLLLRNCALETLSW